MVKCRYVGFIVFTIIIAVKCVRLKEQCESSCIQAESCQFYGNLKKDEQNIWKDRFECQEPSNKGVTVCCPENVWSIDDSHSEPQSKENSQAGNSKKDEPITVEKKSNFPFQPGFNNYNFNPNGGIGNQYPNSGIGTQYPNNGVGNQFLNNGAPNQFPNGGAGNQYPNNGIVNQYPNNRIINQNPYNGIGNQYPNNGAGNQYPINGAVNQYPNSGSGNQYPNNRAANQYQNGNDDNDKSLEDETTIYENTRLWQNRNRQRPVGTSPNPYFLPGNRNTGNSFNARNSGGQCPVTSFPPDPDSGCCGREASDEDRIADPYPQNNWAPRPTNGWPSWLHSSDSADSRKKRDTKVTVDNRIAGGQETELEQFPWTVLVKTTFTYPDRDAAFSCGGSLLSNRYVLTAGHCVYDKLGSIKSVEINLAEFDKRTFPKDCKNVLGKGQKCIENIVMEAEKVHIHPQYDDDRLHNDIALIRLKGVAPYTDYIRPICLPPINVDSPDLSNLRLAVAGWGRNGRYKSDIKQSTIVNLVPNSDCERSYPGISKNQLCAAGYSGEDTCKGDSGGPLMMMYGGKYYVSGVVSGKRADAPCGTSVPSLYTNVFTYLRWIQSIIKN